MNCRRIEKLIPLYVEGDLQTSEAERVIAHSESCSKCRALIGEFEASQQWLRSHRPPEFEDALFDSITRGVMKEIDRKKPFAFLNFFARQSMSYRVSWAMAALLLIFTALAFYFYSRPNAVSNRDKLAIESPAPESNPKDVKPAPGAVTDKSPRGFRRLPNKAASRSLLGASRKPERASRPRSEAIIARERKRDSAGARPGAEAKTVEMMRIEFQTSDPNIRIIWLSPEETDSQSFKPMTETD